MLQSAPSISIRFGSVKQHFSCGVVQAPRTTAMETLPDSLVVRILSKVGDGLMLLDVLPLVCRRWQQLCRDPEAWAEVDVVWTGKEEGGSVGSEGSADSAAKLSDVDVMRLLLRAPAVRELCIDWSYEGRQEKVLSALRRGRVVARDTFQVDKKVWMDACHANRVALLDTLWRSRGCVRMASVSLYLEEELDDVDSDSEEEEVVTSAPEPTFTGPLVDSQGHTALQVLASLQRLGCLDLDASSTYPYAGELKAGLPNLRFLLMNEGDLLDGVLPEQLALDLIRGAPRLRMLSFGSDYGRPAEPMLELVGADRDYSHAVTPALLESVSLCSELRFLSGPDELAAVVGGLPLLEVLSIGVHPKTEDDDAAAIVGRVLARCAAAPAPLKTVSVYVLDVFVDAHEDDELLQRQKAECERHVKLFKTAKPEAAVELLWD
ncbi:uncharacterized protein LOC117646425 isoform X3 [Thrips palmi]|uniref:Uncharacterized protein LOC117646425 isoform X3 n=1 Tax=Thrips palmi TaxID=161013 RepID=A0A6P8ZP03_THRPL|nr:uncharacterized protein LOC117646425 isoform X3 [Thrips palmi]